MRSIQIFCRRTSHNLNAGAIIVFVFSLAFVGLSKDIFAKDISSKFTASDADQEINIAIVDPSGKPIRQIKTQEELDDWTMENQCEEASPPMMFVGIPKDKAAVLGSRLVKDSARRAAACMARGYREKGKLDKAVEYYSRTIDLGGTALETWIAHEALADIYQEQRNSQLAIQQLNWLIAHSNEKKAKELSAIKDDLLHQPEAVR